MVRRLPLLLLPAVLLAGCDETAPCDGRGDMLASPQGLVVTEAEHGAAWGEAQCFGCHAAPVLHRTGCTAGVDLSAVREEVAATGLDGCADCHGDNGVGR